MWPDAQPAAADADHIVIDIGSDVASVSDVASAAGHGGNGKWLAFETVRIWAVALLGCA